MTLTASVACGSTTSLPLLGGETTGGDTGGSESSSSTAPQKEPEASSDETMGDPGSNFLGDPDAGAGFECSTWSQDCPAGHKCSHWASDGGSSWNATKCAPIVPDPDEIGEVCRVVGNGLSGLDTCVLGAMCWDVDPETNEGTCVELCSGDESNPVCSDPDTRCAGRGPFLCISTCCPLEQDCGEGQGCYAITHDFSCGPDASGDIGGYGDPCEFINACDPGMVCLGASSIPDCNGSVGCCTPFCAVGSTSCSLLDPELECAPWFDEGEAGPGLEHIGACVLRG